MEHPLQKGIALIILFTALAGCFAGPVFEGDVLPNFDGRVFNNRDPMNQGPLDMISLSFGFVTQSETWPTWIDNPPADDVINRVDQDIRVTYISHATTLIQMDGLNILTDPVYSDRASPVSFAGPKRIRAPGLSLSELPPIDVILISHNHYDHLDIQTLQDIAALQAQPPLVLAGLGNGKLFEQIGLTNHRDLQWDESVQLGDVEFKFVECRHRSGRGIGDQMKTLWGSFVIQSDTGNVYFAGDTGYGPHLKEHGEQYGPFELAILPIGAYEPRWFMADVHMNPAEAVQAHIDLNSHQSLSIHFGVFQLTYEGVAAPEQELEAALSAKNIDPATFWRLQPGQSRVLSPTQPPSNRG